MDEGRIFVGIDGGGTKTTAVAFDERGHFLGEAIGSSINYCSVSMDTARKNLGQIIADLQKRLGVHRFTCLFIGSSALFGEASPEETLAFTEGIVEAEHIYMDSDLTVALASLLSKGSCAVAVSGTGSMVVAQTKDGKRLQSGGWGYILGDEGSGYSIALAGIRAAIRSFEGILPPTALCEAVMKHFSLENMYALVDLFYDPPMPRHRIADFARAVDGCAREGDGVAKAIIRREAEELSKNAVSLLMQLEGNSTLGVHGGVFRHIDLFYEAFCNKVHETCPHVRVKPLEYPGQVGAVFCGYRRLNIEPQGEIIRNIKSTYLKEKTDD